MYRQVHRTQITLAANASDQHGRTIFCYGQAIIFEPSFAENFSNNDTINIAKRETGLPPNVNCIEYGNIKI